MMKPIPTPASGITVGGMVGCIVILMEEDSTPDDAIEQGHIALNNALQDALDDLIPTLGLSNPSPTDDDIAAIEAAVKVAVEDAIADNVDFWDVIASLFGNLQDDQIGTAKFIYSHDELDAKAGNSFNISKTWNNEGSWKLEGNVSVEKTLVAGIARSGDWGNRFAWGLTTADFMATNQEWFDKDGLRLVHLETWLDFSGVRRWASIHRTGNWAHTLGVGLTTGEFVGKVAELQDKGMELERAVSWTEERNTLWAGSWRSGLPATQFHHGHATNAFKQLTQDVFDNEDMRITQAIHYEESGSPLWAGIYQKGDWGLRFYLRNDLGSFLAASQEYFDKDGLRIVDFETWIEGGARRYAGISRSGDWGSRLWVARGVESFHQEAQQAFDDDKLRLIDVDVYWAE
jgi:hypothetical protein